MSSCVGDEKMYGRIILIVVACIMLIFGLFVIEEGQDTLGGSITFLGAGMIGHALFVPL